MSKKIRPLLQINRSTLHIQTRDVLNAVADGREVLITERGRPFAVIVPLREYERLAGVEVKGVPWTPGFSIPE